MSEIAIRVENLSKRYNIGVAEARPRTFAEAASRFLSSPIRNFRRLRRLTRSDENGSGPERGGAATRDDLIWALNDVSFEVKTGEVIGVIGRNGAGKSTLLKILSRITHPTSGRVTLNGRVASLLEVGTGFHSELTGRENIYLNGTILGMSRREIDRKFDEIVDFSGVEKFIDTPVKRYSSGMGVRLAFSVAAHLEPEILLVDEVLAVGDAEFQKKSLGKMGEVARAGRTVLFVSHNMPSIRRLCPRTIWISSGGIRMDDGSDRVVMSYLSQAPIFQGERRWEDPGAAPGNPRIRLGGLRITDGGGRVSASLDVESPFSIAMDYELLADMPPMRIVYLVSNSEGLDLFTTADTADPRWAERPRPSGAYTSICAIPGGLLKPGRYSVRVSAEIPFVEMLFLVEDAIGFEVLHSGSANTRYPETWAGVISPRIDWTVSNHEV